jgi:hypothetical protein
MTPNFKMSHYQGNVCFDMADLQAAGITTYRLYGGMPRGEWHDDDGIYSAPTIVDIKATPPVESHARRPCGSRRRGATQCCRGRGVEQGRLFQTGTRCLKVKHATWRRRAIAGPCEGPSGAAAPLRLRRTTVRFRPETLGLLCQRACPPTDA